MSATVVQAAQLALATRRQTAVGGKRMEHSFKLPPRRPKGRINRTAVDLLFSATSWNEDLWTTRELWESSALLTPKRRHLGHGSSGRPRARLRPLKRPRPPKRPRPRPSRRRRRPWPRPRPRPDEEPDKVPDEERDAGGSVGQAVAAVSGEQLGGTSAEQWAARQRAPAEEGVTKRGACQELASPPPAPQRPEATWSPMGRRRTKTHGHQGGYRSRLKTALRRQGYSPTWPHGGTRIAIKEDIGAVSKQP